VVHLEASIDRRTPIMVVLSHDPRRLRRRPRHGHPAFHSRCSVTVVYRTPPGRPLRATAGPDRSSSSPWTRIATPTDAARRPADIRRRGLPSWSACHSCSSCCWAPPWPSSAATHSRHCRPRHRPTTGRAAHPRRALR